MAGKKDRKFCGVLYPDSSTYNCEAVLKTITEIFPAWCYVLHDMDTDENGEIKKAHYHWVGKQENPVEAATISNKLGIPENDVCFCKNWKAQVRYQIHADNPEKFQYPPEAVKANFNFGNFITSGISTEKAQAILEHIYENQTTSTKDLAQWCIVSGNWDEFRRGFSIWANIMKEIERSKQNDYCRS